MVCRAVQSVLSQTSSVLECIVVIDGPDPATVNALKIFEGTSVKILALPENIGGCEARNVGARAARGEWIALLDDDDEWLPKKIESQLAVLSGAGESVQVVFSRYLDRAGALDLLRPRRFPRVNEPISEYLWCNVTPFGGIDSPQTSTWLIKRTFLLEVPFTRDLKALQDLDWLLNAFGQARAQCLSINEPLTLFHNEQSRERVAKHIGWKFCYEWGMKNRELFTRKGFGFYLLIYCINRGIQQDIKRSEVISLLKDMWKFGSVGAKLMALCFLYIFVYPWVRKAVPPRTLTTILYHGARFARLGR
jgi:glycosyltransferase involved in cell wall biosynthesis